MAGAFVVALPRLADLQDAGQIPIRLHIEPAAGLRRQRDPLDLAADELYGSVAAASRSSKTAFSASSSAIRVFIEGTKAGW